MKGIDVSVHNGKIDFQKVKAAGIDFVIIRAGYGKSIIQKDKNFEQNYKAAKAAGLLVGAYWYSYALSVAEAAQEALTFLEAIKGKQFEMPVYYDVEEKNQFGKGAAFCSEIVKVFCNALEKAGYFVGLYTSRYAIQNYFHDTVAKRYALWLAEWSSKLNYTGTVGVWQNSSAGKVNGITGNVDTDISYIDYPAIIKKNGLNGYRLDIIYTVQDGDTVSSIADRFGITVDNLAEKNGFIKSGQMLKV